MRYCVGRIGIVLFAWSALLSQVSAQELFWKPAHGVEGGSIRRIVAGKSGSLFVNTDTRWFASEKMGERWNRLPAISPISPDDGALCITENGTLLTSTHSDILSSRDNGHSWLRVGITPNQVSFRTLQFDRSGNLYGGTYRNGFYVSADTGKRWTRIGPENQSMLCVNVNPLSSTVLAGSEGGIYRTTNAGRTWSIVSFSDTTVAVLDIAQNSAGVLFAATSSNVRGGLIRSTDGGVRWEDINSPSKYCHGVVCSNDSMLVVVCLDGVFVSGDGGSTWIKTFNDVGLSLMLGPGGDIYLGTLNAGLFTSHDAGHTWHEANAGITAARIQLMASNNSGGIICYGNNLLRSSTDFGVVFKQSSFSHGVISALALEDQKHVIVASGDSLFESGDFGKSWKFLAAFGDVTMQAQAITFSPDGSVMLVGGDGSVFRSVNDGRTWARVKPGTGLPYSVTDVHLVFDADGTGFLNFVDYTGPRLYRTRDAGMTWSQIGTALNCGNIFALCLAKHGSVYIGTERSGVFRSTDHGESWQTANGNLAQSERRVAKMAVCGDAIVLYTQSEYLTPGESIFISSDDGYSWKQTPTGLPPEDFVTVLAGTPGGDVYVGTQASGVYHGYISTNGEESPANLSGFRLAQNYPNPFNPSTVIRYHLSEPAHVRLVVYNTLGQIERLVLDRDLSAGENGTTFDGTGLASGVYFYRLEINSLAGSSRRYTEVRKMVLTK